MRNDSALAAPTACISKTVHRHYDWRIRVRCGTSVHNTVIKIIGSRPVQPVYCQYAWPPILNCCVEQCNRDNLWELLLRCTNGVAKGQKNREWQQILSKNVLFIGQIKNQVLKQCPPTWKTSTGKKVTCGRGHGYSYGKLPVAAKWYCHQLEQDFSVDWKLSFQYWLMDGSVTGRALFHQKIHLQISF